MTIKHLYPTTRPSLDLNFAQTKRLDPRVTFTRGSTATYVGSDGLIKTAASDEARFDHDGATGESLGLLVEESRTNLLTHSEEFDNAAWSKTGATVTANTTAAPDGTTTADTLTESSTSGVHIAYPSANSTVANPTVSCFVKASGRDYFNLRLFSSASNYAYVTVSLIDGSITVAPTVVGSTFSSPSAKVDRLANSWFRVSLSVSCSSTSVSSGFDVSNVAIPATRLNGAPSYLGDGTSGIYIWGAQLETGSFPTSYIPTTGSTATRSADVASMTGTNFSSWYNQSEGTLLAVMGKQLVSGVGNNLLRLIAIADSNSTSMSAGLGFLMGTHTGAAPRIRIRSNIVYGGGLASTIDKWAWAAADNNMSIVYDGSLDSSSTTTTMPTVDQLNLFGTCTINRLTYYDRRLTDAQLQALTL